MRFGIGFGVLFLTGCSSTMPDGVIGAAADELAHKMERAVNAAAWKKTGAVTWNFRGSTKHTWDRRRNFELVEWDEHRVLIDIGRKRGRAFTNGTEAAEPTELLESAYARWVNDSFWLNPVVKAFDDGVVRKLVPSTGAEHRLLVQYTSGGNTPGDAYLWILDGEGRPAAWQMWTSNLSIKGLEASWDGWIELDTGAKVSTRHKVAFYTFELEDARGASDLDALLGGEDPFAPLLECDGQSSACSAF